MLKAARITRLAYITIACSYLHGRCQREVWFFDQCSVTLKSDGIFVINLWGSDKNFDIYLQRIEQSFEQKVLMMRTGKPGNIVVFGFNKAPRNLNIESLQEHAKELATQHEIEFTDFIDRLCNDNQVFQKRLLFRGDAKEI